MKWHLKDSRDTMMRCRCVRLGREDPGGVGARGQLGGHGARRGSFVGVIVAMAIVGLFGCQGDVVTPPPSVPTNAAPQLVGSIPAQTVFVGESVSVNLATYFSDPDGDALSYGVASSDSAVVSTALSGSTLGLSGRKQGAATVTVTARDPSGLSVAQTFQVTVPNRVPAAVGSIAQLTLGEGDTAVVDVSAHFADPDGDALSYAAVSSDSTLTAVSMDGAALTVAATRWGMTTVTVTATDAGGLAAEQTLSVIGPNRAPMVVDSVPELEVEVGGEVVVVASRYFHDPDGDLLVYRAETSDADVIGGGR